MSIEAHITIQATIKEGSTWGLEDTAEGFTEDQDLGAALHEILKEDILGFLEECSIGIYIEKKEGSTVTRWGYSAESVT